MTGSAPARTGMVATGGTVVIERPIDDGPTRRFPAKSELIDRLVEKGLVADEAHLLAKRPDLVSVVMLDWIQSTQPGCVFAVHLAKRRDSAGWTNVVLPDHVSDHEFQAVVDAVLCPPSPESEMIMVTFPWVERPEDLAEVIRQLGNCTGWSWEDSVSFDGLGPEELLVELRWLLPSGEAKSWVLGFAPFDFMPFTRRAPYAAIVMRPVEPPEWQQRPEDDLAPVHLAQVPHFFGERGRYKGEIWTETERQRAQLLGGELVHAAKAHVTFALPRMLEGIARPETVI